MTDEPPDSAVDSSPAKPALSWLSPRTAPGRLVVSFVVGVAALLLVPLTSAWHVRAMIGWDAGALTYLALAWILMLGATPEDTRKRAALEDPGRRLTFVIAIGASMFSFFAAGAVLRQLRGATLAHGQVWIALAVAAIILSWFVTHTAFTLRYAHLYYRRRGATGCLRFEGSALPCDLDFAYFAFTIGMTFAVSDVVITSVRVRRVVLLHALVSFAYNTTILALSLNLVMHGIG